MITVTLLQNENISHEFMYMMQVDMKHTLHGMVVGEVWR